MEHPCSTQKMLVIADVVILQDSMGRYSLNTLFQASNVSETKRPGQWMKRKSTQALIKELDSQMSYSTIDVVKGGNASGIYVHELLAVSYAGWISPAFQLKVNQAFIASRQSSSSVPQVRDPAIQMIINMAIQLDETRAMAHQAELHAMHAEIRAEEATRIAQEAVAATGRMRLEEFILGKKLLPQFPGKVNKHGRRSWPEEVTRLKNYCEAYGWPILPTPVDDKPWPTENAYPIQALAWLCQHPRAHKQLGLVTAQQRSTPTED